MDIIDVVKKEPIKRFGMLNWLIPALLFFFLFDIILGVIRKITIKSSDLRGQLEEG